MLRVVEIFRTLQGEGSLSGSPAVFLRLAGCNLWSGHEEHRARGRGGCAAWCDTSFVLGSSMEPEDVAAEVLRQAEGMRSPLVVLTGGEPTLQLRTEVGVALLQLLHGSGLRLALETNGTVELPEAARRTLHHVTVSPKPLRDQPGIDHVLVRRGTDLKVVVPTPFTDDELLELAVGFQHHFVQPMDVGGAMQLSAATDMADRLGWRVSAQVHKLLGLP